MVGWIFGKKLDKTITTIRKRVQSKTTIIMSICWSEIDCKMKGKEAKDNHRFSEE